MNFPKKFDELYNKLSALVSPDIFWDRIKRIEPCGKRTLFDRSVAETHNLICNGVIVHNSGAIEQDQVSLLPWFDGSNPILTLDGSGSIDGCSHNRFGRG